MVVVHILVGVVGTGTLVAAYLLASCNWDHLVVEHLIVDTWVIGLVADIVIDLVADIVIGLVADIVVGLVDFKVVAYLATDTVADLGRVVDSSDLSFIYLNLLNRNYNKNNIKHRKYTTKIN